MKKNNIAKDERYFGLDLLRVLAIILVISVHFFLNTNYYNTEIVGFKMHLEMYIRNFCMSCVPLFLMISGYCGHKNKYDKKFWKRLIDILIIWLFYSIIEYIVLLFMNHESFTLNDFIYKLTNFQACGYSWYIEMYIGLYMLAPIINNAFDNFDDYSKKMIVIITALVFNVPTIVNLFASKYFHFPAFWTTYYYLSYYIYGKYISYKKPNINKKYLIIALIVVEIGSAIYAEYYGVWYDTLPVILQTILLFLIFYNIKIGNLKIKKLFELISILTLDIYLASSLVDKISYPNLLPILNVKGQAYLLYYMPLFVMITFVVSFIYSLIRKKLIKV